MVVTVLDIKLYVVFFLGHFVPAVSSQSGSTGQLYAVDQRTLDRTDFSRSLGFATFNDGGPNVISAGRKRRIK